MARAGHIALTKHHGAGNDFLVTLDLPDAWHPTDAEVVALCHRRMGLGADGLIRVLAGRNGAHLAMDLRNSDGSTANMSGNGIRCMVQAAVGGGVVGPGPVTVATLGGERTVHYRAGQHGGPAVADVDMGPITLGADLDISEVAARITGSIPVAGSGEPLGWLRRVRTVDMGNRHLVLWGAPVPPGSVAPIGRALERSVPGGANVEFVSAGPRAGELELRVWERGAGETLACGTGTCAAVAAVHAWGEGPGAMAVHNPGGTLVVALEAGGARLTGPTRKVADVSVDLTALADQVACWDAPYRPATPAAGC